MHTQRFAVLVLTLALAACGTPMTVVSSSPATHSTAASIQSAALDPLTTPEASDVLPAPLYVNNNGQIWRLETDGITTTQITHEVPTQPTSLAVTEFDTSPVNGALVYVVREPNSDILIQTDAFGQQRTELVESTKIFAPRWSPTGQEVAVRLWRHPDAPHELPSGVYRIPPGGGEPELLQLDDPTPTTSPSQARMYSPVAWSPDGTRVLLRASFQTVDTCELVVKHLGTGTLIPLSMPEGSPNGCGEGVWNRDGSALYVTFMQHGAATPIPGLWRADPSTGVMTLLLPGEAKGSVRLVRAPYQVDTGQLYLFLATRTTLPERGVAVPYSMHHIATDGSALRPLRSDAYVLGEVLRADDESGAVIQTFEAGIPRLVWLPATSNQVVELPIGGSGLRWGQASYRTLLPTVTATPS